MALNVHRNHANTLPVAAFYTGPVSGLTMRAHTTLMPPSRRPTHGPTSPCHPFVPDGQCKAQGHTHTHSAFQTLTLSARKARAHTHTLTTTGPVCVSLGAVSAHCRSGGQPLSQSGPFSAQPCTSASRVGQSAARLTYVTDHVATHSATLHEVMLVLDLRWNAVGQLCSQRNRLENLQRWSLPQRGS